MGQIVFEVPIGRKRKPMNGKMLIPLVVMAGLLATEVRAQQATSGETFETEVTRRAKDAAVDLQKQKANELTIGNFTYSGILVSALKADNLLQIFNPVTTLDYGSPEDNLVRYPLNGRPFGWKLLSINF